MALPWYRGGRIARSKIADRTGYAAPMKHLCLGFLTLFATPLAAQDPAYLVDSNLDQLFAIDLTTGAATLIASTANGGLGTPAGLTWRSDTQALWTVDLSGGEVGTIDVATGVFTSVFIANPTSGWQGIEWDPTTQVFFLLNQNFSIYSLDPTTGVTTLVGASGAPLATALEVDANGGLWAMGFSNGILYSVDKTTGSFTATVTTSPVNMQGMSFDSGGQLYGANTTTDSLYTIDMSTGTTTLVGAHGSGVQFGKGFEIAANFGGNGIQMIQASGCAGSPPVALQVTGSSAIGGSVSVTMNGAAGVPFHAFNFGPPTQLLAPACACFISDPLGWIFGASGTLTVPNNPSFRGLSLLTQGVDLLAPVASCTVPIGMNFTDIWQITIL